MELRLFESSHPNVIAKTDFDNLVGIDEQKKELLNTLHLLCDEKLIAKWHKKYHHSKLKFIEKITSGMPLIILCGDVGCGKTVLANCIASPLAELLDKRILCFETPSNIRGSGKVGEISERITNAFEQVKGKLGKENHGILIIDEADDLATSREQNQAHHEDRSGLNVLLKQIDLITKEGYKLTVILITNRIKVLDPAIIRRASQTITFTRPDAKTRKTVFKHLFAGADLSDADLTELVSASSQKECPYSFSDLIQKVAKQTIFKAISEDKPFSKDLYIEVMKTVLPSPLIQ
jgi:SpoVK/Ycf46/Vps4 family AAA+-type ATPase